MPEPHYITLIQEQKITKNDKKVPKSDRKIPDFENGLKTHVKTCIVKKWESKQKSGPEQGLSWNQTGNRIDPGRNQAENSLRRGKTNRDQH